MMLKGLGFPSSCVIICAAINLSVCAGVHFKVSYSLRKYLYRLVFLRVSSLFSARLICAVATFSHIQTLLKLMYGFVLASKG